jgi:hypothetical protein
MASDNDEDTDTTESEETNDQNIDIGNLNDASGVKDDFEVQVSGETVPHIPPQSDDQ